MDGEINATKSMRSLQITLLDEEDEIDDSGEINSYDDDDEEEEDEEKEPVGLGVLEKPENSCSLRHELFPSKVRGTPAWLDPVNLPTGRSCLCHFCGEPLQFMLQVLPQVLYYFGVENDVNSLDWATIVVYTCEASCDGSMAFKEEFVWVQIASQSSTTHR